MDEERVEELGAQPLGDELAQVDAIADIPAFVAHARQARARRASAASSACTSAPTAAARPLRDSPRSGRHRPARRGVLPRRGLRRDPRGVRRPHRDDARRWPGSTTPPAAPSASWTSRPAWRSATGTGSAAATPQKTYNLVDARRARRRSRPASTGTGWLEAAQIPAPAIAEVVVRPAVLPRGPRTLLVDDELDDWKDWLRWQVVHSAAALPVDGVRRRELRVLRHDAQRHRRAATALEARRRLRRGRDGRGGRQDLRRAAVPAGGQGADGRAGRATSSRRTAQSITDARRG